MIRYTITASRFGRVLLAATDAGVCGLILGDHDAELEQWVREEFPADTVERSNGDLTEWVRKVVDHLDGNPVTPDVPVDSRGTAFQKRVWAALREIPRGETRTYTEVAAALGMPSAVRAVARACALNPVSILTPCHRVVGSDGSLRGYRWGLDRKRKLLHAERTACAATSS